MERNFSCPAVSQICSLTWLPSMVSVRLPNSTWCFGGETRRARARSRRSHPNGQVVHGRESLVRKLQQQARLADGCSSEIRRNAVAARARAPTATATATARTPGNRHRMRAAWPTRRRLCAQELKTSRLCMLAARRIRRTVAVWVFGAHERSTDRVQLGGARKKKPGRAAQAYPCHRR